MYLSGGCMKFKIEKALNGYKLFMVRRDGSEMWIATRGSAQELVALIGGKHETR